VTRTFGTLQWHPGGTWFLDAEPNVMMRLKRVFPRMRSWRQGHVTIKDTPEVARDLEWVLSRWPLVMDDRSAERLVARATKQREDEATVYRILQGGAAPLALRDPALPPEPHQQQAADIALVTRRLLLGDDLGLGKTFTCLLTLRDPELLPALVVCPPHLARQWVREAAKFMPWLRTHIVRSSKVYDPAEHREMGGRRPDVLITTYTKLHGWADHLSGEVRAVIFDEVQELRHHGTKKYEAASQIAEGALLRIGATATPVYNYGGEIHNIVRVLDEDVLGSRDEFIREWGDGDRGTKTKVNDPAALGRYLREIGIFVRRTDADVGRDALPPERIPHLIDADDKTMREGIQSAYDVARRILDKSTKPLERGQAAREIDWRVRQATGIAKAPYVAAFVKMLLESEDRVIVWAWHRAVWDALAAALAEFRPALYTGSESPAAKERAVQAFTKPVDEYGASRVFLMSLRSGAGVDGLQHVCRTGVFGELDWSPSMHDQCIGRLARPGQTRRVRAYFLNTDSGSDPAVMDVLSDKRMQAEPIRDPDAEMFEQAAGTEDRARSLAAAVLEQAGGAPSASPVTAVAGESLVQTSLVDVLDEIHNDTTQAEEATA
jgi:hypothetical protein